MDFPPLSSSSSSSLLSLSQWSTISAHHPLLYVFFFCFIFYIIHLIRRPSSNKKHSTRPEPPKVPGAWPLLGHVDLLNMPFDKFGAMSNTYGPVYSIRMGIQETIVINDWEMVKECFTTHDKLFSNRPVSFAAKYGFNNDYSFNHMPYGSLWRDIRKVTVLSLFSNLRLEMQQPIRTSELNVLFNHLYISSKKTAVSVEMVSWFKDVVFDVIMSVIIGISNDQQQQNGVLSKDMSRKYKKVLDEALGLMETTFAVSDLIPFLEWYDKLTGVTTPMSKKAKEMDSFQEIWLQEHRLRWQSGITVCNNMSDDQDDQVLRPYMESLLSSTQKPQFVGLDTDAVIKAACQDIIFGGYSTVTIALPWTLFFLMNNRQVLNKVRKELDENVGKERQVAESDLKQLPYLQAVLKETLRLYLPGADLSRFASEDCVVGGFHVKAGTKLIINQWMIHRDPNVWPDPLEFKPERFLTGNCNADVDVKGNHYEFVPFGSGRRMCPAVTFATRLMHLVLARLIHGFELNIPTEDGTADKSPRASIPLIDGRISHLQILISPRFGSEVYALST